MACAWHRLRINKCGGNSARRRSFFSPSYQLPAAAHEQLFACPRRNNIQDDDARQHDEVCRGRKGKPRRHAEDERERRQHGNAARRQSTDGQRGAAAPCKAFCAQQVQNEHLRESRFEKPARAEERSERLLPRRVQSGIGRTAGIGADGKEQR